MGKVTHKPRVVFDPLLLGTLERAYAAGYENGFIARPSPELHVLRIRGLVERNPTCSTHWRITSTGAAFWKSYQTRT